MVLGRGPQEQRFKDLACRLGLGDRVHFRGKVDAAVVAQTMSESACVVVPSRAPESFGLVGPEALARNTPVVAATAGGTTEWLVHEKTGLAVAPGDATALAQAISRLLNDPELANRLARRGRHLVETQLSKQQHLQQLIKLLVPNQLVRGAA
jgi:glycosyltransferase involved in cell wall biosynthesis